MSYLVIDERMKARCEAMRRYAESPEHYYRPFQDAHVPGDDPHHTLQLDSYRCVFTITAARDGSLHRHLSVSVARVGRYPDRLAVSTIAHHFGFTGEIGKDYPAQRGAAGEKCIVAAQPYDPPSPS